MSEKMENVETPANAENQQNNEKENEKEKTEDEKENKVPLKKFLDLKAENKKNKEKLASYEQKEKEEAEKKLLEEKKFEELIKNKDAELVKTKAEAEEYKNNIAKEKIKRKISNIATKNGALDPEDVLRFVSIDEFINEDNDQLEKKINEKIGHLKNNKGYLFNSNFGRNSEENGTPYRKVNIDDAKSNENLTPEEKALAMLTKLHEQ